MKPKRRRKPKRDIDRGWTPPAVVKVRLDRQWLALLCGEGPLVGMVYEMSAPQPQES